MDDPARARSHIFTTARAAVAHAVSASLKVIAGDEATRDARISPR